MIFLHMLDASLKGAVLMAAALVLSFGLRNASAAVRHALWSAALVSVLLLPIISATLPPWHVPMMPAAFNRTPGGESGSAAVVEPGEPRRDVEHRPVSTVTVPAMAPMTPGNGLPAAWWLFAVWIAGTTLLSARLGLSLYAVTKIEKAASRVRDPYWLALFEEVREHLRFERRVTLLQGSAGAIPFTWGILRPAVLIPANADNWSEEQRRVVLLHELSHVQRRDSVTMLIAEFAVAVYWFNPLVWLAASRMREERERACDDAVIAAGMAETEYADQLVRIVRTFPGDFQPVSVLPMAAANRFEARLQAILDPHVKREPLGYARAACLGALALATMGSLASMHPETQNPAPAPAGAIANRAIPVPRSNSSTPPKAKKSSLTYAPQSALAPIEKSGRDVAAEQSSDHDMLHGVRMSRLITSHGARRDVLLSAMQQVDTPTDAFLNEVLASTAEIGSNGAKTAVVLAFLDRYATSLANGAVTGELFEVVATISSDGDKRRILISAIDRGLLSDASITALIEAVKDIGGNGDKAAILSHLVRKNVLKSGHEQDFFEALETIGSNSDYEAVAAAYLKSAS